MPDTYIAVENVNEYYQLVNHPINQRINQSINHRINQSTPIRGICVWHSGVCKSGSEHCLFIDPEVPSSLSILIFCWMHPSDSHPQWVSLKPPCSPCCRWLLGCLLSWERCPAGQAVLCRCLCRLPINSLPDTALDIDCADFTRVEQIKLLQSTGYYCGDM